MLSIDQRINAFVRLGNELRISLSSPVPEETIPIELRETVTKARHQNAWFTADQVFFSLREWADLLTKEKLATWLHPYLEGIGKVNPNTIGVVNAGNIPLVGFHDFISVLISGHIYQGKNSSDDNVLLPYLAGRLVELEPAFSKSIHFTERLKDFDGVIATGSNNSARYFEYYFGKVPHIIRKNRNGVALLDGMETDAQLTALGEDVFRYFGLGCRSISHLLLPEGYDFSKLFGAFEAYADVRHHNKYINNYDYYKSILILKKIPFYDNGFLILKKDEAIASPIAILNYTFYKNRADAESWLAVQSENIQCVVSKSHVPFGGAQHPALNDYADGVDTMEFLTGFL